VRLVAYVSREQGGEIRRRARLHGISVSAYLAAAALGVPTGQATSADTWWASLPPARRRGFWQWHARQPTTGADTAAGPQLPYDQESEASCPS
jgi:hypothetical protein